MPLCGQGLEPGSTALHHHGRAGSETCTEAKVGAVELEAAKAFRVQGLGVREGSSSLPHKAKQLAGKPTGETKGVLPDLWHSLDSRFAEPLQ